MKKVLLVCLFALVAIMTNAQKTINEHLPIPKIPYEKITFTSNMLNFESSEAFDETLNALEDAEKNKELLEKINIGVEKESFVDVLTYFRESFNYYNSLQSQIEQSEEDTDGTADLTGVKHGHVGSPYLRSLVNQDGEIKIGKYIYRMNDEFSYFVILNNNIETLNYLRTNPNVKELEYHEDLVFSDVRSVKDKDFEEMVMKKCDFTSSIETQTSKAIKITLTPDKSLQNVQFKWELINQFNNNILITGTGALIDVDLTKLVDPKGSPNPIINGIKLNVTMTANGCEKFSDRTFATDCGEHLNDQTDVKLRNDGKNKIIATLWMDNYVFYGSVGAKSDYYYKTGKKLGKKWKKADTDELALQFAENSYYFLECSEQINLPIDYMSQTNTCKIRYEEKESGLKYHLRKAPKNVITCSFFVDKNKELTLTLN